MECTGNLRKMKSEDSTPVEYHLPVGTESIGMNALIGSRISLEYLGKIHCVKCGRETPKSFAQGYCYPCFATAPETEECVLRPELCRAHEGIARDMQFAQGHCLIEHVVYLANTSGLKVGVTRHSQVPTRWIDQGAIESLEFARTPNRYTAGLLEVALKEHISDKTNWRKMLTGTGDQMLDLVSEKQRLKVLVPESLVRYLNSVEIVQKLVYPVKAYPEKIKSLNFDKESLVEGILTGIKGQYLMFDGSRVINIRKFGGYLIRFSG